MNVFEEVYTECLSVCLSEHASCCGDVPVFVNCFLYHNCCAWENCKVDS